MAIAPSQMLTIFQLITASIPRTFRLYEELEKAEHAQLSDQSVSYGLDKGKWKMRIGSVVSIEALCSAEKMVNTEDLIY